MSTTANGYILDVLDDEGVAIIPAPPSDEMDGGKPTKFSSSHAGVGSTASVSSSCPSRDSVSAAIALVRAKQVAKSAILRAEEQILQPRSVSSDQTPSSAATESSIKDKMTNMNNIVESENAVPIILANTDKSLSISNKGGVKASATPSKNLPSSCSKEQVVIPNDSLPQRPSFEQESDQISAEIHSSADNIPSPPSLDEAIDANNNANTIDDVNTYLSSLGVGALHSSSNDSNNSIERLRMLSSGSTGVSSDSTESNGSSVLRVETLAEISAVIDAVAQKYGGQGKQKALLKAASLETDSQKADPPGPSHSSGAIMNTYDNQRESSFLPDSFSGESLEDSPPPPPGAAVEDEKEVDESNDENEHGEKVETRFADNSFAADIWKTLSTVQEATSMEAENYDSTGANDNEDNANSIHCEDALSSSKQDIGNIPQPSIQLSAVPSDEQQSVYCADGRKEPKGTYEKAEVEVETIPLSNIGVEQVINNSMSLMSTDSQRYTSLEQNESHSTKKASETLGTHDCASTVASRGFSDNGSLPWALRDVASEETMRATGRSRPHFVVSGPRPSNKSRNVMSLFDDTSQQASETASEFRNDLSFGSDDRSGDDDSSKLDEKQDDAEITTSDEPEADYGVQRGVSDDEPEADYGIQRGVSDDKPEADYGIQRGVSDDEPEPIVMESEEKDSTDACDVLVDESGKVEVMAQDLGEEKGEKLNFDPSGDTLEKQEPTEAASTENEAVLTAEEEERGENLTISPSAGDNQSNSFLRLFEDLDVNDDLDTDGEVDEDDALIFQLQKAAEANDVDAMTPEMLVKYFSNVDKRKFEGEIEEKLAINFKKLVLPVINGNIPSIIEEAQIRQAALKANVPLDFVDSYIGHVKDQNPDVAPEMSEEEECDLVPKDGEETEDVDEDDAIAAFLSSKPGAQDFEKKSKSKSEEVETSEAGALPKNSESSATSAIEEDDIVSRKSEVDPDFNRSEDPEVEPDFNRSEDSEVEPDINRSEDSEVEPDINRSEDSEAEPDSGRSEDSEVEPDINRSEDSEVEPDINRSEDSEVGPDFNRSEDSEVEPDSGKSDDSEEPDFGGSEDSEVEPVSGRSEDSEVESDSNGSENSKAGNVADELKKSKGSKADPVPVPKVVVDTDRMDDEMINACKSIESYDEGTWQRRTAMATHGWGWEQAAWLSPKSSPGPSTPSRTNFHVVAATKDISNYMFNKKAFPLARKTCKLSYNQRVKPHPGYFEVDMYSLQECAVSGEESLYKDETPWELRHVRQRFLHERSLTFSRNWFGDLVESSGNDKVKEPICKPKSMEMPMRKIPDPGDWTPEWYTTWGGRKLLKRRPSFESSVDSGDDSYTEKDYDEKDSLRSYSSGSSYEDDEEWEEFPECGTFVNTKQKIGEHVTRVHPDYTSSLRKSRWRKKYFPIGTFPY
jgi:hypothetical protein